jgi:hypothetical protein
MKNYQKLIVFGFLLTVSLVSTAAAQYENKGSLNAWTSKVVSRPKQQGELGFVKIKVGKNQGFDRVVFEFKGDLPSYEVNYVKPPIPFSETDEFVKISGKAFVEVSFNTVPYPDDSPENYKLEFLARELKMPVVQEIKNSDWFEGSLAFAIGLKAKKLYRVQELSNPARLAVDFKQ